MFANPSNVSIYGGRFSVVHQIPHQVKGTGADPSHLLKQHVAFGALHNSAERFDPPKCHPETRVAVLDTIDRWSLVIHNSDGDLQPNPQPDVQPESKPHHQPQPVMWLHGAAGAGKSAIAQTLAEKWQASGRLHACFFFSRLASGRNDKAHLIPTIAYQLTLLLPATRFFVERALVEDFGIFGKNLEAQMESLVIVPLMKAFEEDEEMRRAVKEPIVILIDGLDECNGEESQQEILHSVAYACIRTQSSHIPLSFLISCRPELQIRETFHSEPLSSFTTSLSLNDDFDRHKDIALFLRCKFDEIRKKRPWIESEWPGEEVIGKIVEKSSGNFIYASTVVKHVASLRQDPVKNLALIVGDSSSTIPHPGHHSSPSPLSRTLSGGHGRLGPHSPPQSPLASLDALYTSILSSIQPSSLPTVHLILSILLFFPDFSNNSGFWSQRCFSECSDYSPSFISRLLSIEIGKVYGDLVDVHSVLEVPSVEEASVKRIRVLHASLGDWLVDRERSGVFWVDKTRTRTELAKILLNFIPILVRRYSARLEYAFADALNQAEECEELKVGAVNVLKAGCYRSFEDEEGITTIMLDDLRTAAQLASLEYLEKWNVRIERLPLKEGELWTISRRMIDMTRCARYRIWLKDSAAEHVSNL